MLSWIIVLSWRNQLKPSRIHEVHEVALKHEMITFLFQDPFCPAHIYMDAPEYSVIWISLCHLDNLAVIFLHLFILVLLKFQCFSFSFSAKSFATPPPKKKPNKPMDRLLAHCSISFYTPKTTHPKDIVLDLPFPTDQWLLFQ